MRWGPTFAGIFLAIGVLLLVVALELGLVVLLLLIPPVGDFAFDPDHEKTFAVVVTITMIAATYPVYTAVERRMLRWTHR